MLYRSPVIPFRMLALGIAGLTVISGLPLGAAEPEAYAVSIEKLDPFDTTGLKPEVANLLRNYYQRNFSDPDSWAAVESLRFDGRLHLQEGSVPFTAFKKKPNSVKVVLRVGERHQLVMGYDGREAWQIDTRRSSLPKRMPADEARNFIRDATTGGHLLYPRIAGKTVELLGTSLIDGERAYQLRITLPNGQVIRSFLDMGSFAEVQQVTINNVSGAEEVTRFGNFRLIQGIRIPFSSTLTIDGKQMQQSRIDTVRANQGATPWMFRMPPGVEDAPASKAAPNPGGAFNDPRSSAPGSFFDFKLDGE